MGKAFRIKKTLFWYIFYLICLKIFKKKNTFFWGHAIWKSNNIISKWAEVANLYVEWLFPLPEVQGSNPFIVKFWHSIKMTKINKKRPFLTLWLNESNSEHNKCSFDYKKPYFEITICQQRVLKIQDLVTPVANLINILRSYFTSNYD